MAKNDGGPAFPGISKPVGYDKDGNPTYWESITGGGMSLRDYFAAAALTGYRSANPNWAHPSHTQPDGIARMSYADADADAMLAKRAK